MIALIPWDVMRAQETLLQGSVDRNCLVLVIVTDKLYCNVALKLYDWESAKCHHSPLPLYIPPKKVSKKQTNFIL